jgi:hypothetical protein
MQQIKPQLSLAHAIVGRRRRQMQGATPQERWLLIIWVNLSYHDLQVNE